MAWIGSRDRLVRHVILGATSPLPRSWRLAARAHFLARLELAKARRAGLIIVGHPKSGNTWLRVMLSRLYQARHGLPSSLIAKSDELARVEPAIPRFLPTNGHYSYQGVIGEALAADAPDSPLRHKKVLVLVRHPCDIAVSWYLQVTKRQSTAKRELIEGAAGWRVGEEPDLWSFVRHGPIGLLSIIEYLNTWERNAARLEHALLVRYEDLRAEPERKLREIVELMQEDFSEAEIRDAVAFASFDNLQQLEAGGHFGYGGLRRAKGSGVPKVRRGAVGGYRKDLTPEQVAELESLVAERLSPTLGYGAAVRVGEVG